LLKDVLAMVYLLPSSSNISVLRAAWSGDFYAACRYDKVVIM
jgi:hypothetical protein